MSQALREVLAFFSTEVDDSGIKKGEMSVESFKESLKSLAVVAGTYFGLQKIVDFTKGVLETADSLAKQSQALGVSASDLQGWQWAAQLSGSSAEEFSAAFTKFNRNMSEAAKGAGPAAEALKDFGITVEDVKKKTPIELLDDLAAGLEGVQDPAKRTADFMALFGKSGARLLPLFLEGKEGVKKLRAEVDELGVSFDAAFLEDAQEVNDNVDRLKTGVKGFAVQALRPLLPLLVKWSEGAVEITKAIVPMIRQSSAGKAALVAFGVAGAAALWPLLLPVAGLTLGFLALEDAITFFDGGKSLLGRWIEASFGAGSSDKVRAFAKSVADDVVPAVKDAARAFKDDALPAIKETFAFFRDYVIPAGKDAYAAYRELSDFFANGLGPVSKAVFEDMAKSIRNVNFGPVGTVFGPWIENLGAARFVLEQIVALIKWIAASTGRGIFGTRDAIANSDARKKAAELAGAPTDWRNEFHGRLLPERDASASWWDQLKQQAGFGGKDTKEAVQAAATQATAQLASLDTSHILAPSFASAPVISTDKAPEINQTVRTEIKQNFYVDTPEDMQKAASEGAKQGVQKGSDLLATQAAVVKQGGK